MGPLHYSHHPAEDAGTFSGGGHKIVWHTTEGLGLDTVIRVLEQKRAAPHFVIDFQTRRVVQMVAMDRAARAMAHPSGPDTNRANAIQVEIVGFTRDTRRWSKQNYADLARLALRIEGRFGVVRKAPRSFLIPRKMNGLQFFAARGHVGHVHAPGNDHTDPTGFKVRKLFRLMRKIERG